MDLLAAAILPPLITELGQALREYLEHRRAARQQEREELEARVAKLEKKLKAKPRAKVTEPKTSKRRTRGTSSS